MMPTDRRRYLTYTPELADRVCELMIEGQSLRKICETPGMPSRRNIFNWLKDNADFREKYEIARMLQAEWWSHEILAIADDSSGDITINEHGEQIVDHENINRSRLRVDARKWLMSKLHPQRYGDRVTADVTMRRDVKELSRDELLTLLNSTRAAAADRRGGESPQVY
jgi:hypothetical protein